MPQFSIETRKLRRVFTLDRTARKESGKELVALNDVDVQVHPGELFGLLGPNGAGKTTLIRILSTLLTPTAGNAFVEGLDVVRDLWKVRRLINAVSGGETCGYGILTARENLQLFTELYGIPWKVAGPRVEKMLKVVGLDKHRGVRVNKLSTGMRQRLNFARGFTTDPRVLFLDEPTVGLDVHSARAVRSFIKEWLAENPQCTILLTTHYMAEADELCDRIAIIDQGMIQACDTPAMLKRRVHKESTLDITFAGMEPPPDGWRGSEGVTQFTSRTDAESQTTDVHVLLESPEAAALFIRTAATDGRRMLHLSSKEPTLEDVFLAITGRSLVEATPETEAAAADAG